MTETGQDLLLITVLKGAVIFVTDLARAIPVPTQFEFMAVSSYGIIDVVVGCGADPQGPGPRHPRPRRADRRGRRGLRA